MPTPTVDPVFRAIADPTRREILHLLVTNQTPLSIKAITSSFSLSRQAITKHIRILGGAGLIDIAAHGRERICRANLRPLHDVLRWVTRYGANRDSALVARYSGDGFVPPVESIYYDQSQMNDDD